MTARPSVAVVGSGVAGLTAAYVLRRTHEVTLFESDDRIGGHAHTHDLTTASGRPVAVDTGFIVHNERTYPILRRLFDELGVATQETEMSLSVRCDGCGLEYSGGQGFSGIAPSMRVAARPRYLRMLTEVARFHRHARSVLAAGATPSEPTLGEFLHAGHYSPYFVAHFMTPVVAAVWSCGPTTALQYPARYLFTFLDNHSMLSVSGSPTWRTVVGGSRTYVDLAVKELTAVRTSTPIRSVTRTPSSGPRSRIEIRDDADRVSAFDAVIVATHPDQALRLLGDATAAEREALGSFEYSINPTVLHTDTSVLPTNHRAQASWNYRMGSCGDRADQVEVTYDMTRLQRLDTDERYLVSLNSSGVDPESVIDTMVYHHPQYTPTSVAAQALLPSLNDGVTAFAGAYHGWGFHEDGARSGLAAAESLGGAW